MLNVHYVGSRYIANVLHTYISLKVILGGYGSISKTGVQIRLFWKSKRFPKHYEISLKYISFKRVMFK